MGDTGRITLSQHPGAALWVAEIHAARWDRSGAGVVLIVDWSRQTADGYSEGTLVVRLPPGAGPGGPRPPKVVR